MSTTPIRAAIYARYSSDRQNENSIEDQVNRCRRYAAGEGWEVAEVYTDAAISGASTQRPGLQSLLSASHDGEHDVVLMESLDRLSRDQADTAAMCKRLDFEGVQLVTVAEGEITSLHVGFKGTMNALYLQDLADKTYRGLEGRVRAGRSAGGLSYGYRVARETAPDGTVEHGGREIDEAQARIVRRIFHAYADGQSPRSIAKQLNAEDVPGPRGKQWRDTAIRGHPTRGTGILNNELYVGRMVWNRQRFVKDPETGRRVARPNPPEQWVVEDVPELRIVDDELWDRVKARQEDIRKSEPVQKARSTEFWKRRRPKHLLTGKVFCGTCGGQAASVGRDYIACGNARKLGSCEHTASVRRDRLEAVILEALQNELMDPEMVEEFHKGFIEEANRQRQEAEGKLAGERQRLEEVQETLAGLIDAIANGYRSDSLQQRLDDLEQEKAELEATLEAAPPPAPRLHPNMAELYRRRVEEFHAELQGEHMRDRALEQLRELIDHVVLHKGGRKPEIELVGEVANMVAVAQSVSSGTKEAASGEAASLDYYRRSIKVVAGAGFEPATFRL